MPKLSQRRYVNRKEGVPVQNLGISIGIGPTKSSSSNLKTLPIYSNGQKGKDGRKTRDTTFPLTIQGRAGVLLRQEGQFRTQAVSRDRGGKI